jgi:hypothetical protein
MFQVVLAKSVDPGLVSQQCVLVASELTDIVDNEDVTALNVAKSVGGETLVVEKLHCLWMKISRK